jgi:hypothetical protein
MNFHEPDIFPAFSINLMANLSFSERQSGSLRRKAALIAVDFGVEIIVYCKGNLSLAYKFGCWSTRPGPAYIIDNTGLNVISV